PAAAAVLIAVASPGVVFVATGGWLLVAAVCAAGVKAAHLVQEEPAERRTLSETLAGVRTVARDRHARVLFGLFGAQTIVRGALNVLVVVSAIELLDLGEGGVGWLGSAFGVGGLVGAFAAFSLVGRRRLALPFGVGLILWGAPIALVGVWPNAAWALVMLGLPGLGNAVLDISGLTLLQRITPNRVLGRVFGALEAQVFATIGAGSLLASGLVAWLGVRGALVATGVSLPALALLAWPRLRAIDDATVVPEEELSLLRRVPMLAPLSAVALEHLAANVERVSINSRATVFREGEPGDRFYVIAAGEASVSMGNGKPMKLGPGDCFGEIALLRGVPRTATVTARSDLELFALASEPFLAAVSGNTLSADAADRLVEERITHPRPKPEAVTRSRSRARTGRTRS
ncbi:MAG: cyclic nucleotide-binding domain-containing protein, partial [Actinomycetota bacterium]